MGDDDEAGAQFFKKTVLTKRYKEAKRGYESLSWWQRLLRGSYRGFGIAAGVSGIRTWLAKRPLRQLHEAP
jgi:hypothetical protein